MLTKRRFLAATASLGLPASSAIAASAELPSKTAPPSSSEITLEAITTTLRLRANEVDTPVLRFAGEASIPILRSRPTQPLAVTLHNRLTEPTSLQWTGLRGSDALTGALGRAGSTIPAGDVTTLHATPPDPGTYWFHPALDARDQTARGLAGVLIVEEAAPPPVDQDLVLFIADRVVNPQGQIAGPDQAAQPPLTTVLTVNNQRAPLERTDAPGSRLRLRLINGSTRRVMVVACEGARPKIVAIDGQPSDAFEPIRGTIPMGPGSRFDYVLDLPREEALSVRLILRGTEQIGGVLEADVLLWSTRTKGAVVPAKPPIGGLAVNPMLPREIPLEKSKRAELVFETGNTNGTAHWSVNTIDGSTMPAVPVLRVKRGDTVTLGFANKSPALIPLRVQGQAMRLLHQKDDGWEPYWRDSVLLPPDSRHHVAFIADSPGRWAIESAFTAQLLGGLRCWFEVA